MQVLGEHLSIDFSCIGIILSQSSFYDRSWIGIINNGNTNNKNKNLRDKIMGKISNWVKIGFLISVLCFAIGAIDTFVLFWETIAPSAVTLQSAIFIMGVTLWPFVIVGITTGAVKLLSLVIVKKKIDWFKVYFYQLIIFTALLLFNCLAVLTNYSPIAFLFAIGLPFLAIYILEKYRK